MMRIFSRGNELLLRRRKRKRQLQNGYAFVMAVYILLSLSIVTVVVVSGITARYNSTRKKSEAFYDSLRTQNRVVEEAYENR